MSAIYQSNCGASCQNAKKSSKLIPSQRMLATYIFFGENINILIPSAVSNPISSKGVADGKYKYVSRSRRKAAARRVGVFAFLGAKNCCLVTQKISIHTLIQQCRSKVLSKTARSLHSLVLKAISACLRRRNSAQTLDLAITALII